MINKTSPMFLLTQRLNMIGQAIETHVKEKFMSVTVPINLSLEVTSKQNNNTLPIRSFSIVDNVVVSEQQNPCGYGGPGNFGPRPMHAPGSEYRQAIEIMNTNENGKDFTVLYNNSSYRRFITENYSFQEIEKAADAIFKSLLNIFLEIEHNNSAPRFQSFKPGQNNLNPLPNQNFGPSATSMGSMPPLGAAPWNGQAFQQPFVSGFQQHMNPEGSNGLYPLPPQAAFTPKSGEAGFDMSNKTNPQVPNVLATKSHNGNTKKTRVVKKIHTDSYK